MNISRFADDLLNALVVNNAGRIHPIVFVCHSMGGLIAKQAIINASGAPQFSHIAKNVKGVIFFATPHRGSDIAGVATSFDRVVRAVMLSSGRRYIKELVPSSDRIEDINKAFQHHLQRLFILSFFEQLPTSSVGDVVIVPRASAILDSAGETSVGIHADHISICKYSSSSCVQYKVAASNISRFIQIVNLLSSPDSSPESLDDLALFLYGDELGVKQARQALLDRTKATIAAIIGRDNPVFEKISQSRMKVLWNEELVEGVASLNLPADMRRYFNVDNFRNYREVQQGSRAIMAMEGKE